MINTFAEPTATEKTPPNHAESELCVLGSALLNAIVIDEVTGFLKPGHFYGDANRIVWEHLIEMRRVGDFIDAVTLGERLEKHSQFAQVGGVDFLERLIGTVPHPAHIAYYGKLVRERWVRREIMYAARKASGCVHDLTQPAEQILAEVQQKLATVNETVTQATQTKISDLLIDVVAELETGQETGTKTEFIDLDQKINGVRPGNLVILAARPSVGKTSFAANLAVNVAKAGTGVLFFSVEQGNKEIAERLLSSECGLPMHQLRGGDFDDQTREKVMDAANKLSQLNLQIEDSSGRTVSQMAAVTRVQQRREPIGLIIVDYLQLVEPDNRKEPREQQVATMSRHFKRMAKEAGVPVILLAQLNRAIEQRQGTARKPRLSDLRESGAIEQDADMVWFLDRPSVYDGEANPADAFLHIAKHRNGPTGDIRLNWEAETMQFRNATVDYSSVEYL